MVVMPERSYRILLWTLALTGLVLDQASKYGVFAWLERTPGNAYVLLHLNTDAHGDNEGFQLVAQFERDVGTGLIVPHVNHGALFGFLRDHKSLANAGFAIISLLAAGGVIYWSTLRSTVRDPWLSAALGLILAGTL